MTSLGHASENGGTTSGRLRSLRACKFEDMLARDTLDLGGLRELVWSGVPDDSPSTVRADVWRILLNYLPTQKSRREQVAQKRRQEYHNLVGDYYDSNQAARSETEAKLLRQIKVDLPRTNPGYDFFATPTVQLMMERALFTWAVKNPATGYVQGINDLLTPFFIVFLSACYDGDLHAIDIDGMESEALRLVEADSYWCLSKVLGQIQDNYTFGQPGIQRLVGRLQNIVKRVDEPLFVHMTNHGLQFMQFAFRWMNCLLMREFPVGDVIRLWDTYISEGAEGFTVFHVYVCAVFLVYWSRQLKAMDFQQMMLFIQKLPTSDWTVQEMETLLSEAFVLKSLFHASPKHLV